MTVTKTDIVFTPMPSLGRVNNFVAQRVGFSLDKIPIVDVQMRHATGTPVTILSVQYIDHRLGHPNQRGVTNSDHVRR